MSSSGDSSSGSEAPSRSPSPELNGSQPDPQKDIAAPSSSTPDTNGSQSVTQQTIAALKDGYPATALVNILLQHYGIDFHKYKRNIKTSHKLFELWKSVYDAILSHMDKVESATETPDWDSFLKYTEAIGPFEAQLLGLESPLADNEKSGVPTKDKVSVLITFMGNWVVNRQKLIDTSTALEDPIYTALFDQPQALDAAVNVKQALNEDDKQVLQELNVGIQNHGLQDSDIPGSDKNLVTAVKGKVQAIHTAASRLAIDDHKRMGKVVHAVMALFIPFLAHDNDSEDSHIVSKEVWEAAKVFADETEKFVQDSAITPEKFDEKWDTYSQILMGEVGVFAMQMLTLMRQAAQVRRPFFGRTVGIVRMWQALSASPKLHQEKQNTARIRLQKLLKDTETEFGQTKDEVTSFAKDLQATIAKREESYSDLVRRLGDEIKNYNDAAKWDEVSKAYAANAKVDDEHLKKYHAFIQANERAAELKAQIRV